ncbi:MAG TPA: hypothetical protein PKK15_00470 [Kouleothrix sp.]|uniref:hypothetical protein n=1 Tax=Kouleothrix sp. TaxID=2779161 RepID=UPI002C06429A|nr:hypothetical protein [Kouleothrix sp.]
MLTDGMLNPWKAIASLLPVLYGMLLFMKMPTAGLWLTALVVVVLAVLWFVAKQGYSLWALLPALAGGFLLTACTGALAQGTAPNSVVPFSGEPFELWLGCVLGLGYIGWGVYEARQTLVV